MTPLDLIYAAAPYVAVAIVAANWRPIVWLARTLFRKTPDGVAPVEAPSLWPAIHWLEAGCDPKWAARELRLYAERMGQSDTCGVAPTPKKDCPYCLGSGTSQVLEGGKHVDSRCSCTFGVLPVEGKSHE